MDLSRNSNGKDLWRSLVKPSAESGQALESGPISRLD